MLDRRQSARDKVIYGGVAEIGERGATRDCVVRNISENGANLEFGNVIKLPKEKISLTIARKGRSFLARVIWWRDNFVGVAFSSRQFPGYDTQPEGIRNRMFGNQGVLEAEYGGQVLIRGKNFYRGGQTGSIYQDGAVNNIATFHKNITEGNFENPTVAPSVQSNLITILGRTAAYEKRVVAWDDLLKSTKVMEPNFKGLKA